MSTRKSSRLAVKVKQVEPEEIIEDDDAPEEIGLNVGKEQAIKKIEDEKEGERAAKASKRELAAKRQHKVQSNQKEIQADVIESGAPSAEVVHGEDLLPASILAAIEERKRAQDRAHEQASVITAALNLKQNQKKAKVNKFATNMSGSGGLSGIKKGPVHVQVLSLQARLAAASHGNFRNQRTMGEGSGAKRSLEMLRPARASRQGPASQFVVKKVWY